MKMQLVTIRHRKSGIDAAFRIKREIFNNGKFVDMAFCSVVICKNGFVASGFPSVHKSTIIHDVNCSESIDDFIKAVFNQ